MRHCRTSDAPPDLTICNLLLPGSDSGIDLAQQLRREFEHMAVLLVSADVSETAQSAARSAGCGFVVVSPARLDCPDFLDTDWIPIRPNTDAALMLALAHVLVAERLQVGLEVVPFHSSDLLPFLPDPPGPGALRF